ncbi:Exopolysaccharide synthesis, ExoD [Jannaschia seosinensis]|uniref:Exopolysaccharide synthesis, ExoD n=1 Tax=Jannaschia seosinensis TaxID=313367 RepID=A0A0M7BB25_9RHOB|nr:exopolysaccharide biosynthesis protein [Jannaschia seosinensis]CUH39113.1 Exopolysaccharide synthesis, ExoD [Jannaschia seosinensis]
MPQATEMVDDLEAVAHDHTRPSVGDVTEALGKRSVGALIALPAMLEITPIGGIPGLPTTLALIIAILAAQIAVGRDHLWLPGFLDRRNVSCERVIASAEKLRPVARWADKYLGAHIHAMMHPPAHRLVAIAIITLCFTVPPLELVPFASTIPMATIAIFGLGLLFQDGRLLLLGWVAYIAAVSVLIFIVPWGNLATRLAG